MTTTESSKQSCVRIRNLTRRYREGTILHSVLVGLDLDISTGETVALIGRSGSGKSTLLNLISGIDAPDEGDVIVADLDITKMTERERTLYRREHIGFVYQAYNLVPTLTVRENVQLVLDLNKVPEPEAGRRIQDVLLAVQLADRADSYPDVLSGGEQQRVAVARAIVHQPSLLLADEPTGNLDDKTADSVLKLLDRLVRQTGGTMIVATHSSAVASFCDRIIEIHDGALVSESVV